MHLVPIYEARKRLPSNTRHKAESSPRRVVWDGRADIKVREHLRKDSASGGRAARIA